MAFPNSPYELDPHQEIFSYFNDQIQNVQSADPSTSNNVAQQPFSSPFIPPSQPNNQEFAFTFTGGAPPTVSQPAPAFSETQGYHNPQWSSSQSSQPAPFGLSISSPVDSLTATRSAPYDSGGIAFEAYMPPGTRHVPEIAHPQPVRGHGAPHGFRGVNPSHGGPDPDANTQTSAQMPYTRRMSSRRGGHSRPSLIQTATMRARARQLTQDDSNRGSPSAPRRPQKRRRGPGDDSEEYETESDAELAPTATTTTISTASSSPQTVRLPGACTNCRRVKMKCEFKPDDPMTCRRCRSSGLHCHVEPRRPAMRSNKRQILLDRIRYLEEKITRLIKKIHDPILPAPISVIPARTSNTLGVIAETNHRNIQAWIEKAQASIRPGSNSFLLDTRAFLDHYSSSGSDSEDGSVKGEGEDPSQTRTPSRESLKRTAGGSPKLRSIPMEGTVYGLLANMSLDAIRGHSQRLGQRLVGGQDEGQDSAPQEDDVGVASETYFRPGPVANPDLRKIIIERQMPPEILVNGLVSPVEVDKLFKIFFDKINVFMALLDPMIYTPETTLGRSPFLFTVVCAISSRFYTERPELYKTAMQYAKTAAAAALVDGWKSVEVCQAYILLTAYPIAVRRWEDDRSWLYLGLAIRMATDLDLHRPTTKKPMNEQHEREILNRTRTWLHLFNLDRTLSAQFGKPSMIQEDWVTRNSKEWFRKSIYNMEYDVHTCTYTELLRTVSQFHSELFSDMNSLTGLNQNLDFRAIAVRYDEELKNVKDDAFVRYKTYSREDHGCIMRAHILPFYYNYFRLVMFSFGFQQAVEKGLRPGDDFLQRCLEAASSVVKVMAESLIPTGLVRYAPDAYSLSSTFAAAFLLKLLRPEFTSFLDEIQRTRIIELVTKLIDILGSNDVAVDASHSPKIYSRFLGSHLEKHLKGAQPPKPQPSPRSGAPYKRQRTLDSTRGESPSTIASSSRPSTQQTRTTQTMERWSPGPSGQPRPPMPSPTEASGATAAGMSPGMQVGTVDDHSMDFVAAMHIISQPGFNWDRWDNVIMPGFPWEQDSQPPS